MILSFIFGGYFILDFFLADSAKDFLGMTKFTPLALDLVTIVSAMAFGLGIINLSGIHLRKIMLNLRGKTFSVVLLLSLILTLVCGLTQFFTKEVLNLKILYVEKLISLPESEQQVFSARFWYFHILFREHCEKTSRDCAESYINLLREQIESAENSTVSRIFDFLTTGVFFPLGAAMFSLLAFFIASASFRAFRFKDLLSSIMLVTATLVIIGQNSFFTALMPDLVDLRAWLLNILSASVFRGIALGVLIASLVFAIRIWLGIERVDQ